MLVQTLLLMQVLLLLMQVRVLLMLLWLLAWGGGCSRHSPLCSWLLLEQVRPACC